MAPQRNAPTAAYAQSYAQGHLRPIDFDYLADYAEFLLLDALISNYRLLIVGAGTGGFVRLLRNHREVVCIDRSQEMIDAAVPRANVSFVRADFMEYDGGTFDAISLAGTYGWYEPWTGREHVLRKAKAMLISDGLLLASYVPPASLLQATKAAVAPSRTVVIGHKRFQRFAEHEGFSQHLRLHRSHSTISVLRRMP